MSNPKSTKQPSELQPDNEMKVEGDISQSVIVTGNNNVVNMGKKESKRKVSEEQKKITKKTPVTITAALIAAAATIIVGILNSPLILKYFFPDPIQPSLISTTAVTTDTSISVGNVEVSPTQQPQSVQEITDDFDVEMVLISAGEFTMGSDNKDPDEKPVKQIYLDAFYMDKYEVTNALYKVCVKNGECASPSKQNHWFDQDKYVDHPVMWMTWNMARAYCEWRGARLPTEAEWEKAARGTDERIYPWGNEKIDCGYANYRGINGHCVGSAGDSSPVGSYESGKSIYGVYDLMGNAVEWVSSLYLPYPYNPNDGRENLSAGGVRVLRGGSWNNKVNLVNITVRSWNDPSKDGLDYGFRCAKLAP